jgi:hypothetical protein
MINKKLAWLLMFTASILMALAQWLDGTAVEGFVAGLVKSALPTEDYDPAPPREQ